MNIILAAVAISVIALVALFFWGRYMNHKIHPETKMVSFADRFNDERIWNTLTAQQIEVARPRAAVGCKADYQMYPDLGYDLLTLTPLPGKRVSSFMGREENLMSLSNNKFAEIKSTVDNGAVVYSLLYNKPVDKTEEVLSKVYPWTSDLLSDDIMNIPLGYNKDKEVMYFSGNSHTLLVGQTGSGKGSVMWNLIASLGYNPAVEVWGVDLKRGTEMSLNTDLFSRLAMTDDDMVDMFYELYDLMNRRSEYIAKNKVRDFSDAGLRRIFVAIDEMSSIVEYMKTMGTKERKTFESVVFKVFQQGRSAGITVFCATQNFRSNFQLVPRSMYPQKLLGSVALATDQDNVLPGSRHSVADASKWASSSDAYSGRVIYDNGRGTPVVCKAFYPDNEAIMGMESRLDESIPDVIDVDDPKPLAGLDLVVRERVNEIREDNGLEPIYTVVKNGNKTNTRQTVTHDVSPTVAAGEVEESVESYSDNGGHSKFMDAVNETADTNNGNSNDSDSTVDTGSSLLDEELSGDDDDL